MISQAINRWLRKLFAWWPWKRSPETSDMRVVSTLNKGTTQESTIRTTVEGSIEQPGSSSIAVEHADNQLLPDPSRTTPEERPERVTPTLPDVEEKHAPTSIPRAKAAKETSKPQDSNPTYEQKLEFLQYLVRRGVVNEGFAEGQTPDQYKH